jgi:hypothetical protein
MAVPVVHSLKFFHENDKLGEISQVLSDRKPGERVLIFCKNDPTAIWCISELAMEMCTTTSTVHLITLYRRMNDEHLNEAVQLIMQNEV